MQFCQLCRRICVDGVDNDNRIVGAEIDNNKRSAIQDVIREISPVIDVPSGKNKPYFFSGSTYIREEANCQKLTNVDEIRDAFRKNNQI